MGLKKKFEKFIEKGSSVQEEKKKKKWTLLNIRVSEEVLKEIDSVLNKRSDLISRAGWMREAIEEKLKKERNI